MNFHGEGIREGRRRRCLLDRKFFFGGGSSQSSTTVSPTSVYDSRVGVADQGVYAGAGAIVDQSSNDNRTFDDHSAFTSVTEDNRDFSDHRDLSDHSTFSNVDSSVHTTNVTTLDAAVANAATAAAAAAAASASSAAAASSASAERVAMGSIEAATTFGKQSKDLFDSAVNFGEGVVGESYRASNANALLAFDAVGATTNKAFDFAGETAAGASSLINQIVNLAVDKVATSADADRAFASEFTGRIFDTAKSADQANVEKIVKAGTVVVGLAVAGFVVAKLFGGKAA